MELPWNHAHSFADTKFQRRTAAVELMTSKVQADPQTHQRIADLKEKYKVVKWSTGIIMSQSAQQRRNRGVG